MPDGAAAPEDAYVVYIRRFFERWSRVYDLFARCIAWAYRSAIRHAQAGPGRTILDVCTGTGEIARRCAGRGACVTAIDVTDAMLVRAAKKATRVPIRLLAMDARHLAFRDGAFDVAIVSFALHDMPFAAQVATLREAARVARESVVILDYAFPRRRPWRAVLVKLVALYETVYFERFVDRGLASMLAGAGLEVCDVARPIPGFCAVHVARPRRHGARVRPSRPPRSGAGRSSGSCAVP